MIGTKNMVLGLKINWDHYYYMMHQALTSWSLLILDMLVFLFLWLWIGNKDGVCCMWSVLLWTFMNNMTWFFTIQIKIVCMLALPRSLAPLEAWILFYQSTWGRLLARFPKGELTLQVKNSFLLLMMQNSFVLLMWVHGASFVDIQRVYYHIE